VIAFLITKTKKYSLDELYKLIGRSRQQYHQQAKRNASQKVVSTSIISEVIKWRKKHSSMGGRVMYRSLEASGIDIPIGINKFEKLLSVNNLTANKVGKYGPKTSDGKGKRAYPNLTNNLIVNDINQLIVGDITFFWVENKWHYIFTLKDVYSQRILSLYPSKQMKAKDGIQCLLEFEKLRGRRKIKNTIHHTDNGSQYESLIYKKELKRLKLKISRSEICQQNGSAEQLNYIIKNMYLNKWNIRTFKELVEACKELKYINNHERAIKQLKYLTPVNYEKEIQNTPREKRISKKMHDFSK